MSSKKQFQVIAKAHPLKTEPVICLCVEGTSLTAMVGDKVDENVSIAIEGEFIPREMWQRIKPKEGTRVHVTRYPRGSTVKKIVSVVLMVIIAIYAPYLLSAMYAAFGVWGAIAAIGITLLATMAAMALMPPPTMPKMASQAEFNRLNAITGTSNANNPYGAIPLVIGECRFFPPFAAMPYTEILGDQQYLRILLDLGYGDLEVSDIKIGETPIEDFEDVDYEISTDPVLYSDDIFELSLSDAFNNGEVVVKTSQVNAEELSTDIVFPSGLFGANDKGNTTIGTTSFKLEYREVGSLGVWSNVASLSSSDRVLSSNVMTIVGSNIQVRSSARKTLRLGVRWKVATGQYDVRWTRNATTWGSGTQDNAKFDTAQIATLRTIRHTNPSTTGTLKLAVKIKATDQLNGVINQLSVLAQQKIAVYDADTETWSAPAVNFNPAWIYYWLLNACPGVAQHVDSYRIDLPAFAEFADQCDLRSFTCKGIIDKPTPSGDLYKLILAAGRGGFAMRDGKYSILMDREGQVPVQHFSPSNTSGFTSQRIFIDVPHALRVKFQNPALNWQEDEIIVLRDGYSYNGLGPRGEASSDPVASKFETMTCPFVTEPEACWRIGRYHLAQGLFRPSTHSFTADIEHLVCTRGDLVYMTHDTTDWGAGFGLISSVVRSSGSVVQINTAEPLYAVAGQTYSIRVRKSDGTSVISVINAMSEGYHTEFSLVTPMPDDVDIGDLYLLGKTASAIRQLLITRIQPSRDFKADIMAVEYSPDVDSYDEDPPADFISAISGTLILEPPPPPNIYAIFSDATASENSDGSDDNAVNIGVSPGTSGYTPGSFFDLMWQIRHRNDP